MVRYAFMLLALILSHPADAQTSPIPVRIQAGSEQQQTLPIGALVANSFSVRVLHALDGTPLAGIRVDVFVNYRLCIPMSLHCSTPPAELYGSFEAEGVHPTGAALITDGDGRVTAPPFRAGSLPGNYEVAAMVLSLGQPNGVSVVYDYPDNLVRFTINQVAGTGQPATAVPAFSRLSLLILIAVLMAPALIGIRRGRFTS